MRNLVLTGIFLLLLSDTIAQSGIGLRFASNLNRFPRAKDYELVEHWYSTGLFGVFLSKYKPNSGFEMGLNVMYKNGKDGGFNLPVIMRDFAQDVPQVGVTGVEMDLKVGPRFKAINPKIGYILGYRLSSSNFQVPGADGKVNRLYLMLPFGVSVNLPTNYGSVGFGGYYNVGIFNVLTDPSPGGGSIYDGGRLQYLNIEITVTYDTDR